MTSIALAMPFAAFEPDRVRALLGAGRVAPDEDRRIAILSGHTKGVGSESHRRVLLTTPARPASATLALALAGLSVRGDTDGP